MHLGKIFALSIVTCCLIATFGCSPEIGSDDWCKAMKEKPKADWSPREAADYARYCIVKFK